MCKWFKPRPSVSEHSRAQAWSSSSLSCAGTVSQRLISGSDFYMSTRRWLSLPAWKGCRYYSNEAWQLPISVPSHMRRKFNSVPRSLVHKLTETRNQASLLMTLHSRSSALRFWTENSISTAFSTSKKKKKKYNISRCCNRKMAFQVSGATYKYSR